MVSKNEPTCTSAPGRIILFGEHALDFGEPAIAVAVDMRARCNTLVSSKFSVDEEEFDMWKHAYVRSALLNGWTDMDTPLAINTGTDIPPELGLGGLAASTVACLGAISMLHDHIIFEHVAKNAFNAHCEVEGGCTPLDTSSSTHGGCIMVAEKRSANLLWSFKRQEREWHVHDIKLPEMELVLGYSGTPSPALEMRNKVLRFRERNSFAREIIRDIGKTVMDGHSALASGDLPEIGKMMNQNQRLLLNLGVGTPMLEKLVQAVSRYSFGVKISGPGGGGCIVTLAKEPEKAAAAITAAGGKAFRLTVAGEGLRPED